MPTKAKKKKPRAKTKRAPRAVAGATINFMPNDPGAAAFLPLRAVTPRAEGGAGHVRFKFQTAPAPAGRYSLGTDDFLFWQSREAALAALQTFESVHGPLRAWAAAAKSPLPLIRNAGRDLNAYYDRASVSFFQFTARGVTTFSGASTDVVAHECGHAFLDSQRPDLWASTLPEHGAFHEAFGDCTAILTALSDAATCRQLLTLSPDLGSANFVEATAEDLSAGVRRQYGPTHPAAEPRHAFNTFKWRLPSSLPTSGGPSVLTGEAHSFARVFTGCFYDTIRFIFHTFTSHTPTTLRQAAQIAGTLLVTGAKNAVEQARFFQAVGEAMLAADAAANSGENATAIVSAFSRHGISLATPDRAFHERSLLAASTRTRAPTSPRAVEGELRRRVGATAGARLTRSEFAVGPERMDKYVHQREVPLRGLSARLTNVVAIAPEPVVVGGAQRGVAAVRSPLPDTAGTESEVRYFVETLLDRDAIAFDGTVPRHRGNPRRTRGAVTAASTEPPATQQSGVITHVVRERRGRKVLERVRFACRCGNHA